MMTCSRVKPLAVLFFFATLLAAGCTKVDDTLGMEFIPEDQQMSTRIVTIGGNPADPAFFETRLAQMDSIYSSHSGIMILGAVSDPVFGYTSSGTVIQPVPYLSVNTTSHFGYNAVADSMMLHLSISSHSGNTLAEQSFTVYELNEAIDYTASYYPSFDAEAICDMNRPLFRFTHSGTGSLNVRLRDIDGNGQAYMDRLLTRDLDYVDDSVFIHGDGDTRTPFYGLYIIPDQPEADAAMYRFITGYYDSGYVTSLQLCTHNYREDNPGEVSDTVYMTYIFDDNPYYYYSNSVNCIERDYAAGSIGVSNINFAPRPNVPAGVTDPDKANNLTSTPEVATAYVQGMSGVYTQLTFTRALKDRITELAGGKNLAVENATLYLEIEDPRPPLLNAGFTRLGMYENYGQGSSTATNGTETTSGTQKTIPDYNPAYESDYGTSLPYGGYLTREPGYYSMNITTFMQRLIKPGSAYTFPFTVSVVPGATSGASETFSASRIALKGSKADGGNYRIKLKLTYTVIP